MTSSINNSEQTIYPRECLKLSKDSELLNRDIKTALIKLELLQTRILDQNNVNIYLRKAVTMKTSKRFYCIAISIMLFFSCSGLGQIAEQGSGNANLRLIEAAKEIMNSAGTCALITLDDEGAPRVRAMDPFSPEEDLTVWFGTNSKSRKVDQIKKDPRVTLYYLDKDASGYVIIHGMARLVNDSQEKEKRWKADWKAFYPDKTKGYLLIEVSPSWMEILSPSRGIAGDPVSWQPPVVNF